MVSTFHVELMKLIISMNDELEDEYEYPSVRDICKKFKGKFTTSAIRYHIDVLWSNGWLAYIYDDDKMLKCVIPSKNWDEKKIVVTFSDKEFPNRKRHKCGPKKKKEVYLRDVVGKCDGCGKPGRLTSMKVNRNIAKMCRDCLCKNEKLTIDDFAGFKSSNISLS